MEGVPKNKRCVVKTLIDIDKSLSIEELSKLSIVQLLQKVDEYKVKATEVIEVRPEFEWKSPLDYCLRRT
jgi:hypothetical protein